MDDGGWRWGMEDGEQRTENREQRTENTEYRMHAEEGCEVLWGGSTLADGQKLLLFGEKGKKK